VAWTTEICKIGDADVDNVGNCAGYLLATPTRGAFLLTGLGANTAAQMLDAPPRLALLVLVTGVQKAALPRSALRSETIRQNIWQDLKNELVLHLHDLERGDHLGTAVEGHLPAQIFGDVFSRYFHGLPGLS